MSRFLQLHLLTTYPPSNLNRDDLGRPKTAIVGGTPRLRVSSQSLKRAWRTSDVFGQAVKDAKGTRTKELGVQLRDRMLAAGASKADTEKWAKQIAECFGKRKKELSKDEVKALNEGELAPEKQRALEDRPYQIEQLAHFSPNELEAINVLADTLVAEKRPATKGELTLLSKNIQAADIALFGRMLASQPTHNVEAACQVAHAITVHKVQVEDDFFTAVDDLNDGEDDAGAGHIGETEFGSGVFYLYICLDREQLSNTLDDETLYQQTIRGLVEAATSVAPTGKQNSFASRARANFVLAEKGDQQPRSLMVAFLDEPARGNPLNTAIDSLLNQYKNMDAVYGACADARMQLNAQTGEGSLQAILDFAVA